MATQTRNEFENRLENPTKKICASGDIPLAQVALFIRRSIARERSTETYTSASCPLFSSPWSWLSFLTGCFGSGLGLLSVLDRSGFADFGGVCCG